MAGEVKVSELLRDIEVKELILPEFQRGYVWSLKQVKEYISSLYKGFPTGSFLIWKTPHSLAIRGGEYSSDSRFFHLILDGQQRLTSLYTLFKGDPPPFYEEKKLFFKLYFNLETEEFTYYMEKKMKDNPVWIPITEFLKKGDAGRFIQDSPTKNKDLYMKYLTRLNKLNSIRNYPYYIKTITDLDIEEVVQVFNLVNSAGTKLSKADLALAHICSYWPEARNIFKEALKEFRAVGFDFKLDFLTLCISAIAVDSVLFEKSFYTADPEVVKKSWKKVKELLEYIITILKTDAYIDNAVYLKTDFVLIPLLYYLSKVGKRFGNTKLKNKFLYFMYTSLMWGRYSGRPYQTLQSDLNILRDGGSPESLINSIKLWRGGNLQVTPVDLQLQGTLSRFFPIIYIVMRANGAIDWFNGVKLGSQNVGEKYKIHRHHIFPSSVLYKGKYSSSNNLHIRMVNEVANIAFLTQEANLKISNSQPFRYLIDVNKNYPKALKLQYVPNNRNLFNINRYEDFLRERRILITEAINNFLDNLLKDAEVKHESTTKEKIMSGEDQYLEFKKAFTGSYFEKGKEIPMKLVIGKTIASFMNSEGGMLIIGVSDRKKIIGIERELTRTKKKDVDELRLYIGNIISDYIGKRFHKYVKVDFEKIEGKNICKIETDESSKPVFIHNENSEEFYIRTGNSSRRLNSKETYEYIETHWIK